MPTITDAAICIRHWDYSETSQTVGLFTREHGVIRGLAKGAKREKGRFSGGIDLMTRGQVVAIVKTGLELATITDWNLQEAARHLRERLDVHLAGLYFADLVHHLVTDHDPHPALFDQLVTSLAELAEPQRIEHATLVFQWTILAETGYRPRVDADAVTGKPLPQDAATLAFSPAAGGLVEDDGQVGRWRVRAETVNLLRRLARDGGVEASTPEAVLQRANRLLAAYLRHVLGTEPPTMRRRFPEMAG